MLIYVTNKQVAADAGLRPGFNNVGDVLGNALVAGKNAYTLRFPWIFPAIGYADPSATPFPPPAPSPGPSPASPSPAPAPLEGA